MLFDTMSDYKLRYIKLVYKTMEWCKCWKCFFSFGNDFVQFIRKKHQGNLLFTNPVLAMLICFVSNKITYYLSPRIWIWRVQLKTIFNSLNIWCYLVFHFLIQFLTNIYQLHIKHKNIKFTDLTGNIDRWMHYNFPYSKWCLTF